MKKIIFGLLVGCTLSFSIVNAGSILKVQKASFPVWINGEQFKTNKPILTVDNTTYVPVRDFSNSLNANVAWNSENKRVDITNIPYFDNSSVLTDEFKIKLSGARGGGFKENKFYVHFSLSFKNLSSSPIQIDLSKDFKLRGHQDNIISCLPNDKQTIEPGQSELIKLECILNKEDIRGYINFIYKPSIREYSIPISFDITTN